MGFLNNYQREHIENRANDFEALVILVASISTLGNLGTHDQRSGRDTYGRFVAQPKALAAQVELEAAILAVAKRIKVREERA